MTEPYIIEAVEALWPRLDRTYVFNSKIKRSEPADPREGGASYSIQFRMDAPTAQALFKAMRKVYRDNRGDEWDEKLSNPFVQDDNGTFTHKSSLKGAYNNEKTRKPNELDSEGNTLPEGFQLTTGSTVNIAVKFIPYRMKSGKDWEHGVSLRLSAVQVIKYVPLEVRNPFGKVAGGFVYEAPTDNDNPFAKLDKKAAPAKSNNVLDDDDDDDDYEPAPKKTVKKKAVAKDTAEIGVLVDDLFDDEDEV